MTIGESTDPDRRRLLVIGVGNRDRGDDAAGPLVCDAVAADTGGRPPGAGTIRTVVVETPMIDLFSLWEPPDRVVIVDAAVPDATPGRVDAVDAVAHDVVPPPSLSTHGIDVAASVRLARLLARLPAALVVVGIEASSFGFGDDPVPAVRRSVDTVADRLVNGDGFGAWTVQPPTGRERSPAARCR